MKTQCWWRADNVNNRQSHHGKCQIRTGNKELSLMLEASQQLSQKNSD